MSNKKKLIANMDTEDWKRYFAQYDRSSIDEKGNIITYSNSVEELYQMFKTRLLEELKTTNKCG